MSKAKEDYYQFKEVCDKYFEGIKSEISDYIKELESENEILKQANRELILNSRAEQDEQSWRG